MIDRNLLLPFFIQDYKRTKRDLLICWKKETDDRIIYTSERRLAIAIFNAVLNVVFERIRDLVFETDRITYYDFKTGQEEISKGIFIQLLINRINSIYQKFLESGRSYFFPSYFIFHHRLISNSDNINYRISIILLDLREIGKVLCFS